MPVIKRYPNRKLYDTEAKQYITLDGIAELIRKGQEIHVFDYATGEDLTALTFAQIIMEQEKKASGFLPRSVLASLIQAGGDRFNALQRTVATSLNFWHQIDEEIQRRVQALINQGELSEREGRSLIEKLLAEGVGLRNQESWRLQGDLPEKAIQDYLNEHQIPSRDDLKQLFDKLETLADQLDNFNQPSAKE